jgi:amino acid permease
MQLAGCLGERFLPHKTLTNHARFAWVVIIAAEVDAVAQLFTFQFPQDYLHNPSVNGFNYPEETLQWSTRTINPAVWVTIFLIGILCVNMLRVRIYGEIEYWIGCLKMLFIIGLIMFNVVINAKTGTAFKYYQSPWGFITHTFKTSTDHTYYGAGAHLAGVWTAMTVTIFSMIGFESVTISAAEARDPDSPRHEDAIKLATRKISLRIILLYTLATFTVGLNVPYDDPNLADAAINSLGNGRHSAFILAAVRNNIIGWPRFINGFFILSATSSGINSLYLSSRLLHALALTKHVWPGWAEFLRSRLERTYGGVPRGSVFASWLFGLLAYLAAGTAPNQVS